MLGMGPSQLNNDCTTPASQDKDDLTRMCLSKANAGTVDPGFASIGQNPTEDEIEDMIDDADEDGSGSINFPEFVGLMMKKQEGSISKDEIKQVQPLAIDLSLVTLVQHHPLIPRRYRLYRELRFCIRLVVSMAMKLISIKDTSASLFFDPWTHIESFFYYHSMRIKYVRLKQG